MPAFACDKRHRIGLWCALKLFNGLFQNETFNVFALLVIGVHFFGEVLGFEWVLRAEQAAADIGFADASAGIYARS